MTLSIFILLICLLLSMFFSGVETAITVKEIADLVCERLGLSNVRYRYTGGNVGWKGDVPKFQYDLTKIHATGWTASHTSDEAVEETVKYIKGILKRKMRITIMKNITTNLVLVLSAVY